MKQLQRSLALLTLTAVASAPISIAQAGMVGTDQVVASQQAQADRARIQQWLDRDGLQQQLAAQGVDMATAQSRIAALSDAEVARMNQQLDQLPAGQGILGLAAMIFVVFIITDAVGATDVFTFVKPIR